jgi:hypothetical protein
VKIIDVEQGSTLWLQARCGKITASEMKELITPKFAIKKSDGVETYLTRKLAERWSGTPSNNNFKGTDIMELGQMLESEARNAFCFDRNVSIQQVGLVVSDCERYGASPDGLIGEDSGLELKCPMAHTHVGYVLGGVVPEEYEVQVHMSMFVTGRPSWHFMSYHRGFPSLILKVERDELKQSVIASALAKFIERYDIEYARLIEINGGPPRRAIPFSAPEPKPEYSFDQNDFTP